VNLRQKLGIILFVSCARTGWSKVVPDRDEMLAYLRRTAKKYGIYERTRFNTVVKSLVWETHTKCWTVRTVVLGRDEQEQVHQFNIV
jgi:cation diffusion facilitator CzcD-associated flavoprotein CzcO